MAGMAVDSERDWICQRNLCWYLSNYVTAFHAQGVQSIEGSRVDIDEYEGFG